MDENQQKIVLRSLAQTISFWNFGSAKLHFTKAKATIIWKHLVILGTHVKTTHQLCKGRFGVAVGVSLEQVLSGRLQLQQMVKINCIAGSQVAHRTLHIYKRVPQPSCRAKHL